MNYTIKCDKILTNRLLSPIIVLGDTMYTNEFEDAFSDFLERHEYDEAENYLFMMVRIAFAAGWKAAGGQPPKQERIFELLTTPRQARAPAE